MGRFGGTVTTEGGRDREKSAVAIPTNQVVGTGRGDGGAGAFGGAGSPVPGSVVSCTCPHS